MNELVPFFAALADPTRLRLLSLMREGEVCVCHLQAALRISQPKISRHLAYLKRAGLVIARRDGKWMHYRLGDKNKTLLQILSETFTQLEKEPVLKGDKKRLKRACC